jgi:hypothetical protein
VIWPREEGKRQPLRDRRAVFRAEQSLQVQVRHLEGPYSRSSVRAGQSACVSMTLRIEFSASSKHAAYFSAPESGYSTS